MQNTTIDYTESTRDLSGRQVRRAFDEKDLEKVKIFRKGLKEVMDGYAKKNGSPADFFDWQNKNFGLDIKNLFGGAFSPSQTKFAMDAAINPNVYPSSVPVPIQFLQEFVPGFSVNLVTMMVADEIAGKRKIGEWYMEQIIYKFIELTGDAQEYSVGDSMPVAGAGTNFDWRTIVRSQIGTQTQVLDAERFSQIGLSLMEQSTNAANRACAIIRNAIFFNGWNATINRTYGILNDPNLFPVETLPSLTPWAGATFAQIVGDLSFMLQTLQQRSQSNVDPKKTPCTFLIPQSCFVYLDTPSSQIGYTPQKWLNDAYPAVDVMSVPQFDDAVSGQNVIYLMAERISDQFSTDGGIVLDQPVPVDLMATGSSIDEFGTTRNGFLSATAGAAVVRPLGIVSAIGC